MKKLAAVAGLALALSACSSSITEPASPSTPLGTPSATPTATPEPEPEPEPVRNPYEAGAERDWSIDLVDEPSAVVYDRQSGTVVVAIESRRGTMLEAYSVSNSGRTLPTWDYEVADGGVVGSMDASSGLVFVQVGKSDDLVILNARNGAEELRWTRSHVLDPDIPELVGAYDSGGGIVKLGRDSVLTAIVDETGDVIKDERLFMLDQSTDELTVGTDIVNTHLASRAGTAFIAYPEMSLVFGEECWSATDGIVCTTTDDGELSVVEYDRRGNALAVTEIDRNAAAIVYEPVAFNGDVTAEELAEALAQDVADAGDSEPGAETDTADADTDGTDGDGTGETDAGESDSGETDTGESSTDDTSTAEPDTGDTSADDTSTGDSGTAEPDTEATGADDAAADTSAPDDDELVSEDDIGGQSVFPATRTPAILHDGTWITDLPADAEPLRRGAPFALLGERLINVVTSEELLDTTVLVGEGHSSDMFFEWDGQTLHYLRPLG